jgi:hypothetical protein
VTREKEIVWEFVNPFFYEGDQSIGTVPNQRFLPVNHLYRSYRLPYEWIPQVKRPVETAVIPPPNSQLRVTSQGMVKTEIPGATNVVPGVMTSPTTDAEEEGRTPLKY